MLTHKRASAEREPLAGIDAHGHRAGRTLGKNRGVASRTYIAAPPFFTTFTIKTEATNSINTWARGLKDRRAARNARIAALMGDSITTNHIYPADALQESSPAGQWLLEHGILPFVLPHPLQDDRV